MALLNSYSDDVNMVVNNALAVTYSSRFIREAWCFEYTRNATKSYTYVGMTYEAAKQCAADKREKYYRQYTHSSYTGVSSEAPTGITTALITETGASIEAVADGDSGAYNVNISVNETDSIVVPYRGSRTQTPEEAFASYVEDRGYDGEDEPEEEEEE